jgi:hypothetical protein
MKLAKILIAIALWTILMSACAPVSQTVSVSGVVVNTGVILNKDGTVGAYTLDLTNVLVEIPGNAPYMNIFDYRFYFKNTEKPGYGLGDVVSMYCLSTAFTNFDTSSCTPGNR